MELKDYFPIDIKLLREQVQARALPFNLRKEHLQMLAEINDERLHPDYRAELLHTLPWWVVGMLNNLLSVPKGNLVQGGISEQDAERQIREVFPKGLPEELRVILACKFGGAKSCALEVDGVAHELDGTFYFDSFADIREYIERSPLWEVLESYEAKDFCYKQDGVVCVHGCGLCRESM